MVVYIREAHPSDGWKMPKNEKEGIDFSQPKTAEERGKIAAACKTKLDLSIPFVVDGIDNKVGEAYAGWPDRLYIVDREGKIAYKGGPGPRGFVVSEMAAKLDEVLKAEKKP